MDRVHSGYFGGQRDLLFFVGAAPAAGVSAPGISVGLGERDGFCGVFGGLWFDPAGLKIVIWCGLIRLGAKVGFGARRAIRIAAGFARDSEAEAYQKLNV
jgi:hypothetical protein